MGTRRSGLPPLSIWLRCRAPGRADEHRVRRSRLSGMSLAGHGDSQRRVCGWISSTGNLAALAPVQRGERRGVLAVESLTTRSRWPRSDGVVDVHRRVRAAIVRQSRRNPHVSSGRLFVHFLARRAAPDTVRAAPVLHTGRRSGGIPEWRRNDSRQSALSTKSTRCLTSGCSRRRGVKIGDAPRLSRGR